MIKRITATIAFFSIVFFTGCDQVQDILNVQLTVEEMRDQIDSLNEQVANLKKDVESQQWQLKYLTQAQDLDNSYRNQETVAYLTPGNEGYSTVRFNLGVLTVMLGDISPYANGSKVILEFGNPLSASINGLKATIEWGQVNENGSPQNESSKSKQFTLTKKFRSASWNKVSVVLDGTPPNKLGFIRVSSISHTGISLSMN